MMAHSVHGRADHRSSRAAAAAALLLLAAFAPLRAGADEAQPPPTSPSEPPFWARPRAVTPDCACDKKAAEIAAPEPRSGPSLPTMALVALVVALGVLLWRQSRRPQREEVYIPRSEVVVPPPPPPPPPGNGLDPRLARLQVTPREGQPAAPADPTLELALADPRAVKIEMAEDEPAAESEGAQAFYSEIANTLIEALRNEPNRQDLRRKLLEVYFLARQAPDFINLAHEYLELNHDRRDEFWPDIAAMGARLAPQHEMFRDPAAGPRPRSASARSQQRRFEERNVDQAKTHAAQQQLTQDFEQLKNDTSFHATLSQLLADSARRPAPLLASPELAYVADGAQIFIKHEDRRRFHDDVVINATAQLLMAQKLGRKRVVTATRDCVHGHAVASAAAKLGISCGIYISDRDLNRYYTRVLGLRRLGAQIRPLQGTAEEPVDPRRSAMDAWLEDPQNTQYICGLTAGPDPFPEIVREFQSVIGRETAQQLEQMAGVAPTAVVAGVADGHLGIGMLTGFLPDESVQLFCVEEKTFPDPPPRNESWSLPEPPEPGVLTRREHEWLRETGRVDYVTGDDQETLRVIEQFHATGTPLFTHSARSMSYARSLARRRERKEAIVVLLVNQEAADMRGPRYDW